MKTFRVTITNQAGVLTNTEIAVEPDLNAVIDRYQDTCANLHPRATVDIFHLHNDQPWGTFVGSITPGGFKPRGILLN